MCGIDTASLIKSFVNHLFLNTLSHTHTHTQDEAFFLVLADEKESDSHNKLTHFLRLMEPTIALLKHAESVKIPKFAPEAAMAQAEAAKLQFGRDGKVLPQAVAGAPGSTKDGVRMLGGMIWVVKYLSFCLSHVAT